MFFLFQAEWSSQNKPPPDWPLSGHIKFNNYKTRYREGLDLVLKGVTLSINHGEKVILTLTINQGEKVITEEKYHLWKGDPNYGINHGEKITFLGGVTLTIYHGEMAT